jgi:hypothetical protein
MVWLEGDNPFNSTDSRSYGPVPLALVKGLVSFKVRSHVGTGRPGHAYLRIDTHTLTPLRIISYPNLQPPHKRNSQLVLPPDSTIPQQLYPMHEFGPVPRTYRRPGVLYPRLDYETGITR